MDRQYLQRRYLVSFESRLLPHIFTDVLIIGSGVAGVSAALAAEKSARVIVLTKSTAIDSNTYHAQGGLAAAISSADSVEAHIADTLAVGCGIGDERVVREVIGSAPKYVDELTNWGVPFDRENGGLALGREAGHSAERIIHAHGDATGKALADVLLARSDESRNIKTFEHCYAIDLLTDPPEGGAGAKVIGALTYHSRYGLQIIMAGRTILASGGAGMLWRETTNPSVATSDAIAMAFRAGAELSDLEMMQFHPTTLYVAGATRSLISEAVRGEGAYLLDRNSDRFMQQYHPDGELAPRDVVSRAILQQMGKTNAACVYLDVRHIGSERFAARFPQINKQCRDFGIDPGSDPIPVHPAAHYMIGGASVDLDGRTSLPGLLACGEAASTGLHGANRLASNSLTEALVLGQRCGKLAAEAAAKENGSLSTRPMNWENPISQRTEMDLPDIRNSLRSVMWRNVGIVRRADRLRDTREIVGFWGRYVLDKEFYDTAGWEIQNMLTGAFLITESALRRTETRGVHYRSDFPETDPAWAIHQKLSRCNEQLVFSQ